MGDLTARELEILCPDAGAAARALWREQLALYGELLRRWARRMSLVAGGDLSHLGERHFAPALRLRPILRALPHAHVLDVGSGGGLPAIPLKIVLPDMALTLVESRRRRCSFLREGVRALGLQDVEVLHQRLEDGDPHGAGSAEGPGNGCGDVEGVSPERTPGSGRYAAATLRAVALTPALTDALRRWLAPGAFLISSLPPRARSAAGAARLLLDRSPACSGGPGQGVRYGVWRV